MKMGTSECMGECDHCLVTFFPPLCELFMFSKCFPNVYVMFAGFEGFCKSSVSTAKLYKINKSLISFRLSRRHHEKIHSNSFNLLHPWESP